MIICNLSIRFDRGVKANKAEDFGLGSEPSYTEGGGIIRGLGTHFISETDRTLAQARSTEEQRIRTAFRRAFLVSPIHGTFILPRQGDGQRLLDQLGVRADMKVSVNEFSLAVSDSGLESSEVSEWAERIKAQLVTAPLGKTKQAGPEGLGVLGRLADCPLLSEATRNELRGLLADARLERVDRLEVRRRLEVLDVQLDQAQVAPRRAPLTLGSGEVYEGVTIRRAVAV